MLSHISCAILNDRINHVTLKQSNNYHIYHTTRIHCVKFILFMLFIILIYNRPFIGIVCFLHPCYLNLCLLIVYLRTIFNTSTAYIHILLLNKSWINSLKLKHRNYIICLRYIDSWVLFSCGPSACCETEIRFVPCTSDIKLPFLWGESVKLLFPSVFPVSSIKKSKHTIKVNSPCVVWSAPYIANVVEHSSLKSDW